MNWAKDEIRDLEDEIEEAGNFFYRTRRVFGVLGLKLAEENVMDYREGLGQTKNFTKEDLLVHEDLRRALDRNRTNFEIKTFIGKTGKDIINQNLLNMKDGDSYEFNDYFEGEIKNGVVFRDPDLYAGLGQTQVSSSGKFKAKRVGNELLINGETTNGLGDYDEESGTIKDELYDFNPGQVGSRHANILEKAGQAHPFYIHHESHQPVEARVLYQQDGSLKLDSVIWKPLK